MIATFTVPPVSRARSRPIYPAQFRVDTQPPGEPARQGPWLVGQGVVGVVVGEVVRAQVQGVAADVMSGHRDDGRSGEVGVRVTRIGWAGTKTDGYGAMVDFLTAVLGLTLMRQEHDVAVLDLPSGDRFEVFGPGDQDHQHFTTGPVVGFVVEDLPAAVAELERAGVALLGGHVDERGLGWRHFRAPDGNVYELTSE
jgi:predicted enzyme related to lactoylglutathione lyase